MPRPGHSDAGENPTILLTFATVSWQKGSAAQVESLVGELRRRRPELRFRLLSHWPELDRIPARALGVEVVDPGFAAGAFRDRRSVALLWRRLRGAVNVRMRRSGLRPSRDLDAVAEAYASADLVADLSGDSYRDPPGGFALAHHAGLVLALASGVPFALASQSVGPFWRPGRPLTRWVLRRARFLYVRERRSTDILTALGIPEDRIRIAPDVAFALPAAPAELLLAAEGLEADRLPRPWFGLSLSHLAARLAARRGTNAYRDEMARTAAHLQRVHGGTVFLIPHELAPFAGGPDDRREADVLRRRLGAPPWLHSIRGDHAAPSLKGLIARCEALIASRMHAGIAGLSSGVPTLLVSWSHKYLGIMEKIGLPEYVWEQREAAPGSLPPLFDRMWRERARIRERLLAYTARARREIARTAELLAACIPDRASDPSNAIPAARAAERHR